MRREDAVSAAVGLAASRSARKGMSGKARARRLLLAALTLAMAVPAWAGGPLYLWKATAADMTVYLFGTVHLCRADCFPLPDEIVRAADEAGALAVELDLRGDDSQSRLLARGLYPAGQTLHRDLSAESVERLRAALAKMGVGTETALRMRPWMAVSTLTMMAAANGGYDARQGVDEWLISRARARGIAIVELETLDEQLSSLDMLSGDQQEEMVRQTVDMVQAGTLVHYIGELVEAWRGGDPARVLALSRDGLGEGPAAPGLLPALVNRRNQDMAARIAAEAARRRVLFVAVGALHFAGDNNILDRLRTAGFAVRQLTRGSDRD
jgi:hypothetical protein